MGKNNKSIFTDGGSLILRHMMASPKRSWVVRDFESELGLGRGWVAHILSSLRKKGYLKGEARGRQASATLRHTDDLIKEWTQHYQFANNQTYVYYTHEKDILPKIRTFFKKRQMEEAYALTLHSGTNLITHYVRDPNVYLYMDPQRFKEISLELRIALNLKELKQGGNVYFLNPYYKRSTFYGIQKIKGLSVVSNLQLYLDLAQYPQRGKQHADYLVRILKEEGKSLV